MMLYVYHVIYSISIHKYSICFLKKSYYIFPEYVNIKSGLIKRNPESLARLRITKFRIVVLTDYGLKATTPERMMTGMLI